MVSAKSNVFDVIAFLSSLAGHTLYRSRARCAVEGPAAWATYVVFLGDLEPLSADEIQLGAEMIIPPTGEEFNSGRRLRRQLPIFDMTYTSDTEWIYQRDRMAVSKSPSSASLTSISPTRPAYSDSLTLQRLGVHASRGGGLRPTSPPKMDFILLHADSKGGKGGGWCT